jgi:DNA-binding NtrC family response regulator
MESMFFGHVRGAFTGATSDRKGIFELANGGTLFLDEIGDMPAALQGKLLRVLEDGRVQAVGATTDKQVDVRIIAATNANLETKIASGAFRQDLYFRLARTTVRIPPLRERKEDVPLLAAHFIKHFSVEIGFAPPAISDYALTALRLYDFPGNVRELRNLIESALIASGGAEILPKHLRLPKHEATTLPTQPALSKQSVDIAENSDLPLNLEAAEHTLIRRALVRSHGNVAEAARLLGVHRSRIYRVIGEATVDTVSH